MEKVKAYYSKVRRMEANGDSAGDIEKETVPYLDFFETSLHTFIKSKYQSSVWKNSHAEAALIKVVREEAIDLKEGHSYAEFFNTDSPSPEIVLSSYQEFVLKKFEKYHGEYSTFRDVHDF
jgi:hypothetical protein